MNNSNDKQITSGSVIGGGGTANQNNLLSLSTLNEALAQAIENAITYANQYPLPLSEQIASKVEEIILGDMNAWINYKNMLAGMDGTKISRMNYLSPAVIARLMIALEGVKALDYTNGNDSAQCQLGIYQYAGRNEGIYATSEAALNTVIRKYHFSISASGLRQVRELLLKTAPVVMVGKQKNLIAVNNGIFDYETKRLLEFSPEYVFVSKCRVDLLDNPSNISIHNNEDGTDWNIEDWIHELTDDPQIEKLLWQIIGASIRPNVRWNKALFLYSTRGNNGKGTFCT